MIRDSGKMWNAEGKLQDAKAVIPDRCYAGVYQAIIDDCKQHGAFNPVTMGSVPNVGLMAQAAEEYGSHNKTFVVPATGTVRVTDASGKAVVGAQFKSASTKIATVDASGVEVESKDDIAPYVAMGFKSARSDGSDDYIWLYKGKFAPGDETFHTKEQGSVNWQTPVLNGKFGSRVYDGKIRARVNSEDQAASAVIATFFDAVYSS